MKRAVITLTLLAVSPVAVPTSLALADDPTLGERVGERVDGTQKAVTHAAESAQERASQAAAHAKERASEVADQAKEHASQAAESLSERAHDVAHHAEDYATALVESAKAKAEELSQRAAGMVQQGKSAAGDTLQSAREQARSVLIGAAVALDNKSKEARQAARKASWAKLKARFSLLGNRPSLVMSEELRDHEYRVARLRRARELAASVDDSANVSRSDRLLEQEYGRHKRRVEEIDRQEREESAK